MKLFTTVGTSLGSGAVIAAATWHYVSEQPIGPGFWQHSAFAGLWSLLGGAGGIGVLAYAVLAFVLLTGGALHDLDRVRARLSAPSVDPRGLPGVWRTVLADTDFETLAEPLPGEELAIAPLALMRVLRHEIWRIFGTRLLATQLVTVALVIAALAGAAYLGPTAPAQPDAMRLEAMMAALALAILTASWLMIDEAIRRLTVTVSRIATAWEATLRVQSPAPPRRSGPDGTAAALNADMIVAAIDRLSATIEAPSPGAADISVPALAAIEAAVRDSASRQGALIGGLCETLTIQIGVLARAIEQRDSASDSNVGGMGEALTQLAAAVDKLADPLLRRMRLLDASDRRLLTVLRRQEEAVGSVGTRWGELVAALQAMSSGLDSFARAAAARQDHDQRLLSGGAAEPAALSEELQELLDEMSDYDETGAHRSTT